MAAPSEEALAGGAAQDFGTVAQAVSHHGTPTTDWGATAESLRKAIDTLKARLALRGFELHELADGTLMVSRWNLTRQLADLDAAQAFAEQAGA